MEKTDSLQTQFGFRKGRGATDAIFAARRRVELAMALKYGQTSLLALDWKKALGCISPVALGTALRRFGVPEELATMIDNLYADRRFVGIGGEGCSQERRQHAGISQGCPLSPFLFAMLMTVVMHDAVAKLPPEDQRQHAAGSLASLLFADDTLLIGL